MWQRARLNVRPSLDKFWGWTALIQSSERPEKVSSELFWPTTLDKECDKAARILRTFCKDGFRGDDVEAQSQHSGKEGRNAVRIPAEIIKNAKGLAIFTIMRTGLWVSGAGGSGVLLSRLPDGTWSPPSAIVLHTDGVDFLVGIDMYDCVMVINTEEAMSMFSQDRYTVGSGLGVITGPLVSGEFNDSEFLAVPAPIYTYLKSQGKHTNVQLLGAIMSERSDENERFYQRRYTVSEIISGKVTKVPSETNRLVQTIKASQGDTDIDPSMIPLEGAPSDFDIANGQTFGVPNKDDPDPFGVLALEKEGLVIREAASKQRATRASFQFTPSPNSPLFNAFNRGNVDVPASRRSSWRTSVTERSMTTMDMATQTDLDPSLDSSRPQSLTFRSSMTSIVETDMPSVNQTISRESSPWDDNMKMTERTYSPEFEVVTPVEMSMAVQTEDTMICKDALRAFEKVEEEPKKNSSQDCNVDESGANPTAIATQDEIVDDCVDDSIRSIATIKTNNHKDTTSEVSPIETTGYFQSTSPPTSPTFDAHFDQTEDSDADDEDADSDIEDEVIIHEIIQAPAPRIISATPQLITKAKLVNVSKLAPPAVPSRNPNRTRMPLSASPTRSTFNIERPATADGEVGLEQEGDRRPSSSAGSSVYSLKKDDVPFSAGATESLGSISSLDDADIVREVNLDASLHQIGISTTRDDSTLHDQDKANEQLRSIGLNTHKAE